MTSTKKFNPSTRPIRLTMARSPFSSLRTTQFSNKVFLILFLNHFDIVGDGATSVVVKACRHKDINDSVAIKKVKRVFEHTAFAHRAMRELRLLRCLGSHENVFLVNFAKGFIGDQGA